MQSIISAQGGQLEKQHKPLFEYTVTAKKSGYIHAIDNLIIANIASLAGAPIDKFAGIDWQKKKADKVNKGDVHFTIYACFKSDFEFSTQFANDKDAYTIDKTPPTKNDNYFI